MKHAQKQKEPPGWAALPKTCKPDRRSGLWDFTGLNYRLKIHIHPTEDVATVETALIGLVQETRPVRIVAGG